MISICIKSKKIKALNELEKKFDKINLPGIYYSQKKFKNFNNIIVHYKGTNKKAFFKALSIIILDYIIENCEANLISNQLKFDYFYFNSQEKSLIQETTLTSLNTEANSKKRALIIENAVTNYFKCAKNCNLDGFISFRLYEYTNLLNSILEEVIKDFVLKKEYLEYVSLLKEYVSMQVPLTDSVHLIYSDTKKILLDSSRNIIANTSNPKVYLSDITFSSNDFILNTLLSLLPKQIYIHMDGPEDNFINFLKLIFDKQFFICNNCIICNSYLTNLKDGFYE